jgi:excisionase family DNA binding protein
MPLNRHLGLKRLTFKIFTMIEIEKIIEKLEDIEFAIWELNILKKEILTFTEATCFLNLSRSHLYKLTSSRHIPHYSPQGKMLYFKRTELEAYLQQNRRKTVEEIAREATSYVMKGGAK